jgi:hypothetical protein
VYLLRKFTFRELIKRPRKCRLGGNIALPKHSPSGLCLLSFLRKIKIARNSFSSLYHFRNFEITSNKLLK